MGVFAKQCGGVFIANALVHPHRQNHIYNCPRAGINVNNGLYGGHVFENNDLHDTVRETSDHGPFNSYGRDYYWCSTSITAATCPKGRSNMNGDWRHNFGPFEEIARVGPRTTIIRRNRFSVSRLGKQVGPGLRQPIDLDDGSSNYEVYENLGVQMSFKTFCSEFCKFHDNVFVRAPYGLTPAFWRARQGSVTIILSTSLHIEIRDNHFVNDLTPAEVEAKFFKGVRFGLNGQFPAWLPRPGQWEKVKMRRKWTERLTPTQSSCGGSATGSSSSNFGSQGTHCFSSNQRPRSIRRQRWLQKGNAGLCWGSKRLSQVGQRRNVISFPSSFARGTAIAKSTSIVQNER